MSDYHIPVLLDETIEGLQVAKGKRFIDATAGGGGHTQAIVDKGGEVLAIDQDKRALQELEERFTANEQVSIVYGNFSDISTIAHKKGVQEVDGILFDIGVSSYQIDKSGRGFSFLRDEPLDMRMDQSMHDTAFDVVNTYPLDELTEILTTYGEEVQANRICEAIIQARREKKIETSKELADIVLRIIPRTGKVHPATKTFQALRIVVNRELESLKKGLEGALDLTVRNGRIVVISFHSLEDRIVKNTFRIWEQRQRGRTVTKNPVIAQEEEILRNPRSRSAKLRIFEKL